MAARVPRNLGKTSTADLREVAKQARAESVTHHGAGETQKEVNAAGVAEACEQEIRSRG